MPVSIVIKMENCVVIVLDRVLTRWFRVVIYSRIYHISLVLFLNID